MNARPDHNSIAPQVERALESAAQHIRDAAKCLDLAAASGLDMASRIEAIEGQQYVGTGMADALLRLLDGAPVRRQRVPAPPLVPADAYAPAEG